MSTAASPLRRRRRRRRRELLLEEDAEESSSSSLSSAESWAWARPPSCSSSERDSSARAGAGASSVVCSSSVSLASPRRRRRPPRRRRREGRSPYSSVSSPSCSSASASASSALCSAGASAGAGSRRPARSPRPRHGGGDGDANHPAARPRRARRSARPRRSAAPRTRPPRRTRRRNRPRQRGGRRLGGLEHRLGEDRGLEDGDGGARRTAALAGRLLGLRGELGAAGGSGGAAALASARGGLLDLVRLGGELLGDGGGQALPGLDGLLDALGGLGDLRRSGGRGRLARTRGGGCAGGAPPPRPRSRRLRRRPAPARSPARRTAAHRPGRRHRRRVRPRGAAASAGSASGSAAGAGSTTAAVAAGSTTTAASADCGAPAGARWPCGRRDGGRGAGASSGDLHGDLGLFLGVLGGGFRSGARPGSLDHRGGVSAACGAPAGDVALRTARRRVRGAGAAGSSSAAGCAGVSAAGGGLGGLRLHRREGHPRARWPCARRGGACGGRGRRSRRPGRRVCRPRPGRRTRRPVAAGVDVLGGAHGSAGRAGGAGGGAAPARAAAACPRGCSLRCSRSCRVRSAEACGRFSLSCSRAPRLIPVRLGPLWCDTAVRGAGAARELMSGSPVPYAVCERPGESLVGQRAARPRWLPGHRAALQRPPYAEPAPSGAVATRCPWRPRDVRSGRPRGRARAGRSPCRTPRRRAPAPASSPMRGRAAPGRPQLGDRTGRRRAARQVSRAEQPGAVSHRAAHPAYRPERRRPCRSATAARASNVRMPFLAFRWTSTVSASLNAATAVRTSSGSTPSRRISQTEAVSRSARPEVRALDRVDDVEAGRHGRVEQSAQDLRVPGLGEGDLQELRLAARAGGCGIGVGDLGWGVKPAEYAIGTSERRSARSKARWKSLVAGEPEAAALGDSAVGCAALPVRAAGLRAVAFAQWFFSSVRAGAVARRPRNTGGPRGAAPAHPCLANGSPPRGLSDACAALGTVVVLPRVRAGIPRGSPGRSAAGAPTRARHACATRLTHGFPGGGQGRPGGPARFGGGAPGRGPDRASRRKWPTGCTPCGTPRRPVHRSDATRAMRGPGRRPGRRTRRSARRPRTRRRSPGRPG